MHTDWFKDWFNTPYYHLLYRHRDQTEAARFIDRLLLHLDPGMRSRMLDLACGKGRHALMLANKGFDVTGVDLSEASISSALSLAKPNLDFYIQDMRIPCRVNYFHYVFSFFTSFGYFKSDRENLKVFKAVHQSLLPRGTYVLDYLNVIPALTKMNTSDSVEENGILLKTRKYSDQKFIYKEIEVQDPAFSSPLHFEEAVRIYHAEKLSDMLKQVGFKVKEIFGDYQLNAFDNNLSPRVIVVAEK
jgi:SAM-dependent methyltransferase